MKAIEGEEVAFAYPGSERPLVHTPYFSIDQGKSLLISGPSGCGKSTLLSLFAGLQFPQKGAIRLWGTDLHQLSSSERDHFRGRNLGFIFQQFNLISHLSVRENILLPLDLLGINNRDQQDHCDQLLQDLSLWPQRNQSANELSLGQQQRVACARALIHSPKLLLCDEPTSSLDDANAMALADILLHRTKDCTLVVVSHDARLKTLFSSHLNFLDSFGQEGS